MSAETYTDAVNVVSALLPAGAKFGPLIEDGVCNPITAHEIVTSPKPGFALRPKKAGSV